MAQNDVVYFEGGTPAESGYALAPEGKGEVAPLLVVFTKDGAQLRRNVPRRAEGGGVTYREEK